MILRSDESLPCVKDDHPLAVLRVSYEAFKLQQISDIMSYIKVRKQRTLSKTVSLMEKFVSKDLDVFIKDLIPSLKGETRSLVRRPTLSLFPALLSSPHLALLIKFLETEASLDEPIVSKGRREQSPINDQNPEGANKHDTHESWALMDKVFTKETLDLFDRVVRMSYSPKRLFESFGGVDPRGMPVGRRTSKTTKRASWKVKIILNFLRKPFPSREGR